MPTPKPHPPAQPKKTGRPTKYTAETAGQAEKLCRLGATDEELADFFGVNRATLSDWKVTHPELKAALDAGKAVADAMVERKLFERACGYSHPEDDIRTLSVGLGKSKIVVTPTTKHYPPDTVACIFWLKNRRPDRWRSAPVEGEDTPEPVKVTLEVVDGRRPSRAVAESAPG